jgi:hypothetical protein
MTLMKFAKKPNFTNAAKMPTPVVVTILILICMVIIFTIESVGLSNRTKNIEMREVNIERCKLSF